MRIGRWWQYGWLLLVAGSMVIIGTSTVMAQTSSSPTYKVTETEFGATSAQQTCSGEYCAKASIGDMPGESAAPETGTAVFTAPENDEPRLEVIVEPGVSNLGVLTTEAIATKTMIVKISNYLGEGYELLIEGDAPTFNGHALTTHSTPTASNPGVEQFGINLAHNTTPAVGAAPQQVPAGQGTFGTADADYQTPNLFKFSSGDVIARSQALSGRTDYTISMVVAIANATPAGHYSGDFAAVVVPVF